MKKLVELLISKLQEVIVNVVLIPFKYILLHHGLISALCFATCMILMGYAILLYSNNKTATISEKEIETIQQDAANGNADAQRKLGDLYFNGIGLKQDYKKAFTCYMQSANQGNIDAQYQIGLMYHDGKGVPIDYHKAYLYYSISNINGNPTAYLEGMLWMRKKKLLTITEIADITVEAQNMAKRMRKK